MSDWFSWRFWRSVALISENLMVADNLEIEIKYKFYVFLLFRSVRTSKNFDEHIAFIDGEKMLC